MPPHPNQRRSNVRRANVTACLRCKSRKQRCDQSIPACSNCEAAGAECVSIDINGQIAPRSYIKSLEDRVAHLEKQLVSRGIHDYDSITSHDTAASSTAATTSAVSPNNRAFSAYSDLASSAAGVVELLTAAPLDCLATDDAVANVDEAQQTLLEGLPYEAQTALPSRQVADVLTDAYFEHSDSFSPILVRSDIDKVLYTLYHDSNTYPDPSILQESGSPMQQQLGRFRVMLVFAIAARLLNRKDSSFPISRSEAYFALATRLLRANRQYLIQKAGLDQLENLALIVQYLFFSSNLAAAWSLLGLATRMVVDLAIYRTHTGENSSSDGRGDGIGVQTATQMADSGTTFRKQWIFWATYSFERILCHVLNRPCSIPDDAITIPLPSITASGEGTDRGTERRHLAVHLIKHRKLSSEIETTIGQSPPANGATLDYAAWRNGMWHRLQEWRRLVPSDCGLPSQLAPTEIFDGCYYNSMIRLYLPSPHLPVLNGQELTILAHSATAAVENYKICFKQGKLRFYWRTLHHLFRAGIALVHCLRVLHPATTDIRGDLKIADIKSSINLCSAVLWDMVERYHLGRAYRDTFENISSPVLNAAATSSTFTDSTVNDYGNIDDSDMVGNSATPIPESFMDIYVPSVEFGLFDFE